MREVWTRDFRYLLHGSDFTISSIQFLFSLPPLAPSIRLMLLPFALFISNFRHINWCILPNTVYRIESLIPQSFFYNMYIPCTFKNGSHAFRLQTVMPHYHYAIIIIIRSLYVHTKIHFDFGPINPILCYQMFLWLVLLFNCTHRDTQTHTPFAHFISLIGSEFLVSIELILHNPEFQFRKTLCIVVFAAFGTEFGRIRWEGEKNTIKTAISIFTEITFQ